MGKLLLAAGLALATLTAGAVTAGPASPQGGCSGSAATSTGVKGDSALSARSARPCAKNDSAQGGDVQAPNPLPDDRARSRPAEGNDPGRCHWKDEVYRDAYGVPVQRQVEVCR